MVVSILLMRMLSENIWSFNFILKNFTQIFTCQSSQFTDTKIFGLSKSKLLKIILIIYISIWLQISSIITKAFTGLLLSTYSNIHYIPVAGNLEQIYQDQNLEVYSTIGENGDELKNIFQVDSKMIDNIIEREESFRRKYNMKSSTIESNVNIFEKIITCKLVVICNTDSTRTFKTKFIKWGNMLSVSDKKFLYAMEFHRVRDKKIFTKTLYKM